MILLMISKNFSLMVMYNRKDLVDTIKYHLKIFNQCFVRMRHNESKFITYQQESQNIMHWLVQHHNYHRPIRSVTRAFLRKHELQIRCFLHVHNILVDRNRVLMILVANRNRIDRIQFDRNSLLSFTSSETLKTPTIRALHFIGRSFTGQ